MDRRGGSGCLASVSSRRKSCKIALIIFYRIFSLSQPQAYGYPALWNAPPSFVLLPICVLLYFQPNYSAIIVLAALTFIMMFVGGAKAGTLPHWAASGCRRSRDSWCRSPIGLRVSHPLWIRGRIRRGDGYQVIQSLYGIGSGGLFRAGDRKRTQKLSWLPYGESDFIFFDHCGGTWTHRRGSASRFVHFPDLQGNQTVAAAPRTCSGQCLRQALLR